MHVSLLGPMRALAPDGQAYDAGPPQQQAMLATVALTPGVAVSMGRLIDALWGEEMPARAAPTVRTYAWRLRKLFSEIGAEEILVSAGDGYRLAIAPAAVDANRAEELGRKARGRLSAGDPEGARAALTEALALWSGEPLAGVPGPFAQRHRDRLGELHAVLTEQYLETEILLGNYAEAQSRLAKLIAENPLRERPYALLMRALYGMGRQVEALRVFHDARQLLGDEHGLDPGPELTDLHERILRGDADIAPVVPAAEPHTSRRPIPAQLPPDLPDFTGRAAPAAMLRDLLTEANRPAPALVAIIGMSGVGKTSLAVHLAHRVRDHYPDGQLYVELNGRDTSPLRFLLTALGEEVPAGPDDQRGLFRSLLDGRRMLIVLDDVAHAGQVRDALPGAPGCAVLVTGHARLDELPVSEQLTLDGFDEAEALDLMRRRIGDHRVAAEHADAVRLIGDCGLLPLAVRIVASRLAARPGWSLRSMADRLSDRRRRLAELRAGSLTLTAVFDGGYGQLTLAQARDFVLLAAVAGADFTLDEAAAVLAVGPPEAEQRLESLVDLAMLDEPAPSFYRFHELLHDYALGRPRDRAGENVARQRLLAHLLATSFNAHPLRAPRAADPA